MKARRIGLAAALCFLGAVVCYAQSPFLGTWKLNAAKSKYDAGATKVETVVYEAAGENIKVTVDGTDPSGNPVHWEWTGKFDGKPYPVTGSPMADMATYRRITSHTVAITQTKAGKVVLRGRITVSANGKTRTVNTMQIGPKGQRIHSIAVYDKQ